MCNESPKYIWEEKAIKCIHVKFTGGFSKVRNAHIWMKEHMDKKNTSCTGIMYEVYNQAIEAGVMCFFFVEKYKNFVIICTLIYNCILYEMRIDSNGGSMKGLYISKRNS